MRESRAAYMRDYRQRKKLGLPTTGRTLNHEACDQQIAQLTRDLKAMIRRVEQLQTENDQLRETLPF